MKDTRPLKRKVTVVGAGAVGSTFCYALALAGIADEIALIDANADLARGQVMDLSHGLPFMPGVTFTPGTVSDFADAAVIVVTAGAKQKPGESRRDLVNRNAAIIRNIVRDIVRTGSGAVLLIVSNPVDVLTFVALEESGWERGRVLGSGTVLDSARLRHLLSTHCRIDVHNTHAYILGEHGDSEFAAWTMSHIGGVRFDEYCPNCGLCGDWKAERLALERNVRESAYHIIDYKGATNFAVGLAVVRIVEAILRDRHSVLTVSAMLRGEFGLQGICLSVPCVVSNNGIERIIETALSPDEKAKLNASASILKELTGGLARP